MKSRTIKAATGSRSAAAMLLALASLLFTACTAPRTALSREEISKVAPTDGLVVATFQRVGVNYGDGATPSKSTPTLLIRGQGPNQHVTATLKPRFRNTGGTTAATDKIVVIAVPAGAYLFHSLQVVDATDHRPAAAAGTLPSMVPFVVKAGRTSYLGRVTSYSYFLKAQPGFDAPIAFSLTLKDRLDEDIPLITSTYPEIRKSSISRCRFPEVPGPKVKKGPWSPLEENQAMLN